MTTTSSYRTLRDVSDLQCTMASFRAPASSAVVGCVFVALISSCLVSAVTGWRHDERLAALDSLVHLRDLAEKAGIFIGSESNAGLIGKDQEYDQVLAQQFSLTTPENSCKWGAIRPTEDTFKFEDCDHVVTNAENNNQSVRGHNLCWGAYNPDWLNKYAHNSTKLSSLLTAHITTVTGHFKGRLYCWDVVNEAVLDNPEKGKYLKQNIWYPEVPNYIDLAFRTAHAGDGSVQLFYNDYNCEMINGKSDAIYAMLKTMLANGVPVHGMGIQAHLTVGGGHDDDDLETVETPERTKLLSTVSNWTSVEANIKRFIDLGLEVHITELDVKINSDSDENLQKQADVYRNMLKACLKHAPKCRSFETWGFVDKYSWLSKNWPDYFDAQFKPKPCFYAVADELNKTVATLN